MKIQIYIQLQCLRSISAKILDSYTILKPFKICNASIKSTRHQLPPSSRN